MKYNPVKWSGSKKTQAKTIISNFPKKIDTYYEPFLGSASILYELLNSDIHVGEYIASDTCEPLIDIYLLIRDNPEHLIESYIKNWTLLQENGGDYYYEVRNRFNKNKNPEDFLFLTRTCTNGLIRFNKKGEFNNSLHLSRKGMNPEMLKKVILHWSKLIQDVHFLKMDYKEINPKQNDYMYLDPPYANTKGMYFGTIDYNDLWKWLKNVPCGYSLSFDGIQGEINKTYKVPIELYSKHIYIPSGLSSFSKLQSKEPVLVQESLYLK